ncbi:MAG: hypothetical protein KGL95_08180, partial [Patescibacteria group bacterium]|nr:hypothetical protein [Patescibacteria group bacterium]
MKIHNNKTKTTTAIISALVIGLILLSPTTMLPNVGAQTQIHSISTNTSKSPVCNTHTLLKQLPPFTSLERQKAISLAEESPVFLQKAGDNTYT